MKLRTRLALIAGGVVLLATLLGGGLSFQQYRRIMLDQAVAAARQECEEVFLDFEEYCEMLGKQATGGQGAYYLKRQNDDYSILFDEHGVPIYNQTVLDPAALLAEGQSFDKVSLYEGRRLVISWKGMPNEMTLLHIVDITDVYLTLYRLAAQIGGVTLALALGAGLAAYVSLRRSLAPLQALSEGANAIAAGAYDRRAPEDRADEIGRLGRDFNRMARAVEEHIRRVEDSEEKKTLFMGSLTHELKTPLTAISGYAQTLRRARLSEEDREAALGYICQESARLDRLSKKLLRLLELDRRTELDHSLLPAEELLAGAAEACRPAAQAKGVAIELAPCHDKVEGDRDLLTNALVNLVDNALKASPAGGVVRLYTREGAMVVEDQGEGIPEEELDRLTEPFYMVDKSRSRKSGGAGLGLALTAVILRRHGMSLRFETQTGAGTKAIIS